jgi:hypothetical protein
MCVRVCVQTAGRKKRPRVRRPDVSVSPVLGSPVKGGSGMVDARDAVGAAAAATVPQDAQGGIAIAAHGVLTPVPGAPRGVRSGGRDGARAQPAGVRDRSYMCA